MNENLSNLNEAQAASQSHAAADNGASLQPQPNPKPKPVVAASLSGYWENPVVLQRNNFVNKSLSCWSCNTSVGCTHGCLFCYVPEVAAKKQAGKLATLGVNDPDEEWGDYAFLRNWDEHKFRTSLYAAERTPPCALNPDGNRAVMYSTTTDPYQSVKNADPMKQKQLNRHGHLLLVRRSLELILTESTLNVRILTRSPLAKKDFDLFKRFGNRLLFGMSLPTLDNELARIYEPKAPAPTQRLETLRAAKDADIPVYVAIAPTYPECDEANLRRTLTEIAKLDPVTVFHEPINIRADNVDRIRAHAASIGKTTRLEVFATKAAWFRYSMDQLLLVQRLAGEVGLADRLHLWPDPELKSRELFMAVRRAEREQDHPARVWSKDELAAHHQLDEEAYAAHVAWLTGWWARVSEWPGEPKETAWQAPSYVTVPLVPPTAGKEDAQG
jgi:DNA repair photolyase